MTLAEIVSITGLSGLYKATGKRSDGLIATSLVDGSTKFVSGRQHMFSTLDNITIYTTGENRELKQVFNAMKNAEKNTPVPDGKDESVLKSYFETVIPDYDKEKVYTSHIKKIVSWYHILKAKNLLEELLSEKTEEASNTEEKALVIKDEKPLKESKPKADLAAAKAKPTAKPSGAVKKITTPRKAS